MPVGVVFVAGTALRGAAASLFMRGVMHRHPNAFLVTLEKWGVTLPLEESQQFLADAIDKGLDKAGRDPSVPVVLVGHSQGGLASLRYAIDHPERVAHTVTVGVPWEGVRLAGLATGVSRRLLRRDVPAFRDMAPDSEFLVDLHRRVPAIADRVTNIYSYNELIITPYHNAHIAVPGVSNILIASDEEYEQHLRVHLNRFVIDELIDARLSHFREMNSGAVRSVIWRLVDEVVDELELPWTTQAARKRGRAWVERRVKEVEARLTAIDLEGEASA